MEEIILEILSELSGVSKETITEETRLVGDLGLSSFDLADAVVTLEENCGVHISDERFRELETVADILRLIREEEQP